MFLGSWTTTKMTKRLLDQVFYLSGAVPIALTLLRHVQDKHFVCLGHCAGCVYCPLFAVRLTSAKYIKVASLKGTYCLPPPVSATDNIVQGEEVDREIFVPYL